MEWYQCLSLISFNTSLGRVTIKHFCFKVFWNYWNNPSSTWSRSLHCCWALLFQWKMLSLLSLLLCFTGLRHSTMLRLCALWLSYVPARYQHPRHSQSFSREFANGCRCWRFELAKWYWFVKASVRCLYAQSKSFFLSSAFVEYPQQTSKVCDSRGKKGTDIPNLLSVSQAMRLLIFHRQMWQFELLETWNRKFPFCVCICVYIKGFWRTNFVEVKSILGYPLFTLLCYSLDTLIMPLRSWVDTIWPNQINWHLFMSNGEMAKLLLLEE